MRRTGQRDLEQRLIARGVDVNVRDPYSGWDPLTYAAWRGDAEMIGLLLGAGAQVYDAKNNDWPALTHAAIQGHTDIVRRFLDQVGEAKARNAALCFAARHGHQATAALLLDAGADLQAKGCLGQTPLEAACETGQPRMIRFLLETGRAAAFPKACGNALIATARDQDLASLVPARAGGGYRLSGLWRLDGADVRGTGGFGKCRSAPAGAWRRPEQQGRPGKNRAANGH